MQRELRTIPVVFVNVSDPIGAGFIASLARPGGNFTGVVALRGGHRRQMVGDAQGDCAACHARCCGGGPQELPFSIISCGPPRPRGHRSRWRLCPAPVERAADIERSIDSFAHIPNGGLIFPPDITTITHRDLIIAMAARHRLPFIYPFRLFVVKRRSHVLRDRPGRPCLGRLLLDIDRILRGANPADIPVQAPTKYETTLNLKTAKALDLAVPPGLIVAADEGDRMSCQCPLIGTKRHRLFSAHVRFRGVKQK